MQERVSIEHAESLYNSIDLDYYRVATKLLFARGRVLETAIVCAGRTITFWNMVVMKPAYMILL